MRKKSVGKIAFFAIVFSVLQGHNSVIEKQAIMSKCLFGTVTVTITYTTRGEWDMAYVP